MTRRWPAFALVLTVIALTLSLSGSALANPPGDGSITYHGHIVLNGAAYAYTGALHVQATLWDAPIDGNALETVEVGYVNAVDGEFFTTLPFNATIIETHDWLWIEVAVKLWDDASYWQLYPREAVSTAAYAIRSSMAITASSAITATTSHTADTIPWSGLTGLTCVANQIPKWNGVEWYCAEDISASGTVSVGVGIAGRLVTWATTSTLGSSNVTLAAASPFTLTIPSNGTAALLGTANTFTLGPQTIQTGADGNKGLIIQSNSVSQTANLLELKNSAGTNLGAVNMDGHWGIGANPATANRLYVYKAFSDVPLESYGILNYTTYASTAPNSFTSAGIAATVYGPASVYTQTGTVLGIWGLATGRATGGTTSQLTGMSGQATTAAASTGAYTQITGMEFATQHFGTGLVTRMYGSSSSLNLRASGGAVDGNITRAYGAYAGINNRSTAATPGAITNGYGFFAESPTASATAKITNTYGFYGASQGSAGVTSAYGLYLSSQSGAGTNYSIYANAGLNRLGDQLAIYGSADRTQQIVRAYSSQTYPLSDWQNNNGTSRVLIGAGMAISGTDPGAGNLWVYGDVSAQSFTDRTPGLPPGYDALADLRSVGSGNSKANGKYDIDHKTLPAFASVTKYFPEQTFTNMVQVDPYCTVGSVVVDPERGTTEDIPCETQIVKTTIPAHTEELRDVGAMVTLLTRGVQQLEVKTNNGNGNGKLTLVKVPATSEAKCSAGDMAADEKFFYLCVTDNAWKRLAWSEEKW